MTKRACITAMLVATMGGNLRAAPRFVSELVPAAPTRQTPRWVSSIEEWVASEPGGSAYAWHAIVGEEGRNFSEADRFAARAFKKECRGNLPPYAKSWYRVLQSDMWLAFYLCREPLSQDNAGASRAQDPPEEGGWVLNLGGVYERPVFGPMLRGGYAFGHGMQGLLGAGLTRGTATAPPATVAVPAVPGSATLTFSEKATETTIPLAASLSFIPNAWGLTGGAIAGLYQVVKERSGQLATLDSKGKVTAAASYADRSTTSGVRLRYGGGVVLRLWRLGISMEGYYGRRLGPLYVSSVQLSL